MARCGCDATFCFDYNISIPSTPIPPPLTNKFRGYVAWWCISITNMEPSCIFGGMFNSSNCDGINFSWITTYSGLLWKPSLVIFLKIGNDFQIGRILCRFWDLSFHIFTDIRGMKLHNGTEHLFQKSARSSEWTLNWPRNEEKISCLDLGLS